MRVAARPRVDHDDPRASRALAQAPETFHIAPLIEIGDHHERFVVSGAYRRVRSLGTDGNIGVETAVAELVGLLDRRRAIEIRNQRRQVI